MNRRSSIAIGLACAAIVWPAVLAGAAPAAELQSFYIVLSTAAADPSASYQEILDVALAGDDVRVRLFRISLADSHCSAPLVRAAERVLPQTTIRNVAGDDMCANTA